MIVIEVFITLYSIDAFANTDERLHLEFLLINEKSI